jgi:hypothetical protein
MAQQLEFPSNILGYVPREICRNFGFLYVVKSVTSKTNKALSLRYNLQAIIGAGDVQEYCLHISNFADITFI